MTLFLKINEDVADLPKKHRIIRAGFKNVLYIAFELFVNSLVGALFAIIANHNYIVAVTTGFFSQFLALYLLKFIKSASFIKAFNEIVGESLKTILRKALIVVESGSKTDGD